MNRKAKIIATLGPSSQDEKVFSSMVTAGLDVARLNFSHGTYDDHLTAIQMIRKVSQESGKAIAILQDLQGPKVRIGEIPGDSMELPPDNILMCILRIVWLMSILIGKVAINGYTFPSPISSPQLRAGMKILLDDGNIEFNLLEVHDNKVTVKSLWGESFLPIKDLICQVFRWIFPGLQKKIARSAFWSGQWGRYHCSFIRAHSSRYRNGSQ